MDDVDAGKRREEAEEADGPPERVPAGAAPAADEPESPSSREALLGERAAGKEGQAAGAAGAAAAGAADDKAREFLVMHGAQNTRLHRFPDNFVRTSK